MIAIDLANAVFLICITTAGLLLLAGLLLDDEVGPLLDFLRLRRGPRGVPVVAYVLAFIAGFGIGGLLGTSALNAEAIPAAVLGLVGGLLGILLVWANSDARKRLKASATPKVDLDDLIGRRGRIAVDLRSNALGTVSLSYRGTEREFPATAISDIPAGSVVVVDDVDEAKSTLVLTLASHTTD